MNVKVKTFGSSGISLLLLIMVCILMQGCGVFSAKGTKRYGVQLDQEPNIYVYRAQELRNILKLKDASIYLDNDFVFEVGGGQAIESYTNKSSFKLSSDFADNQVAIASRGVNYFLLENEELRILDEEQWHFVSKSRNGSYEIIQISLITLSMPVLLPLMVLGLVIGGA